MNKVGHVSVGWAGAAVGLFFLPSTLSLVEVAAYMGAATVASLLPDLDHKTSTASNMVQLPTKYRKLANQLGWFLLACSPFGLLWSITASILLFAGGVLAFCIARLRNLIFIAAGLAGVLAYWKFNLPWVIALVGIGFILLPTVRHRGMIHSPEFGLLLSSGLVLSAANQPFIAQAAVYGIIAGWWSHLAGDIFGREGISSLIWPKLRLALRLFRNGGSTERMISLICSMIAICLLTGYILQKGIILH
ncbi:metal-dependent hydrolase [Paenibacillus sp. CAU 1782]